MQSTQKATRMEKVEEKKLPQLSEIEKAGEHVMKHILNLFYKTTKTYAQMAEHINEKYNLNLTGDNVAYFFKTNQATIELACNEKSELAKIRAKMILEFNDVLVKDIKIIDEQIEEIKNAYNIRPFERARAISDLIDKKGKLLLRYEKMCGNIRSGDVVRNKVEYHQTNIINQVSDEKSELISRLKKADFKNDKKQVIDVSE